MCSIGRSGSRCRLEKRSNSKGKAICASARAKRSPQTEMRAAAKGEMACIRPLDIEAVRVGMPRRVVARRDQRGGHDLARPHLRPTDFERLHS